MRLPVQETAERTKNPGGNIRHMRLRYLPPYDWDSLLGFLGPRAIPRVEEVVGGRYARLLEIEGEPARVEVWPAGDTLAVRAFGPAAGVADRARRAFDLQADPGLIGAHLRRDPRLAPLVRSRPGLRVPGAWDVFEMAVCAVIGQQITVRAATTMKGRLVVRYGRPVPGFGELNRLFPSAGVLADADLETIGLTRARAETIRGLASAVASGDHVLDARDGLDDFVTRLCRFRGIGAWTAQYVAMRGLGERDAFPASDLGLRKAVGEPNVAAMAEAWRPFRAYAAMHLWMSLQVP